MHALIYKVLIVGNCVYNTLKPFKLNESKLNQQDGTWTPKHPCTHTSTEVQAVLSCYAHLYHMVAPVSQCRIQSALSCAFRVHPSFMYSLDCRCFFYPQKIQSEDVLYLSDCTSLWVFLWSVISSSISVKPFPLLNQPWRHTANSVSSKYTVQTNKSQCWAFSVSEIHHNQGLTPSSHL